MENVNKILKYFGLFHKLWTLLPQQSLLTNNKSYIRLERELEDIIYDQTLNESLSNRIEAVKYKFALAVTGAVQARARAGAEFFEKNYTRC